MKEAISKLNCGADTEENIIKVLTDKIDVELHNLKKELIYVKSVIPLDENKVKRLKEDIDRCKTRLQTVNDRVNSIKDECCFICTESFNNPAILECCKNVLCLACLLASFKSSHNKCPFCRHQIKNNSEYHVIDAKAKKKKNEVTKKGGSTGKKFADIDKMVALEETLSFLSKNVNCPKILIFSDYAQTFDKIIKNIAKVNLTYAMISGTPSHMSNVLEDFETGELNILLLDSQHYGSGLNLQKADYLILFHRMTSELETQVIGRAHRFGRKIPLRIIYLINQSENSVSKMSKKPFKPETVDELRLLTNPKKNDQSDCDEDSSESEPDTKTKSTDKLAIKSTSKVTAKITAKSKTNPKVISISGSESDSDSNSNSDSDSIPITKKTKKNKKKEISSEDIFNSDDSSDTDTDSDSDSEPILIPKKAKKAKKVPKKAVKKKTPVKKSKKKYDSTSSEDILDI
jgi:hypothetical protein